MDHLLLTCCLLVIAFGVLIRRHTIEVVYWSLASFPALTFIVGITDQYLRGIQQFNHQLLHVAYDSSYLLLLLGIILVLRAILKRRLILLIAAGTCIAGIPLGYIFLTQP